MQDMIVWLKSGISDGYITSDDAFAWLALKAQRLTAVHVEEYPARAASYPASTLQQARTRAPKRAVKLAEPIDQGAEHAPILNKDGTPRRKAGRKPKAQHGDGAGIVPNGVE